MKFLLLMLALQTTFVFGEGRPTAKEDPNKIKWEVVAKIDETAMYRLQFNYLKLKDAKNGPEVVKYTLKVIERLKKSEGAFQYALNAKVEKGQYYLLSVWKDEASMNAFVKSKEHAEAMAAVKDLIDVADFDHWNVTGNKIYKEWSEVIKDE